MDAWYECVDEQSFINCRVKKLNHCYEESIIGDESSTDVNMNNKDDNESDVKVDMENFNNESDIDSMALQTQTWLQ
eukprot:11779544-Ditylum_brightwellii.AAC.1